MSVRRIRRPKDQEQFYKQLTDEDEYGLFHSYKDLFMMAGVIGFIEDKRRSFDGSLEGISWNVFNLETDETVINTVAVASSKDINILSQDSANFDARLQIFEEYAAGGLDILYNKLKDNHRNAADVLFEYAVGMEDSKDGMERNVVDITKIFPSFD